MLVKLFLILTQLTTKSWKNGAKTAKKMTYK